MIEEYQLEFFRDDDLCRIERQGIKTQESLTRVRKGTYGKIGELRKEIEELKNEFETLKRAICRGENYVDKD